MNQRPEVLAIRAQITENIPRKCEDNKISYKDVGLVFREKVQYHK